MMMMMIVMVAAVVVADEAATAIFRQIIIGPNNSEVPNLFIVSHQLGRILVNCSVSTFRLFYC